LKTFQTQKEVRIYYYLISLTELADTYCSSAVDCHLVVETLPLKKVHLGN